MPDAARANLSAAPEAVVVALAQSGDDRAFRELVLRRQGRVRDLMRRLSGDAALADDLAQQAFVQAWRNLRKLQQPGAFGGWLRQVAVNVWLQEVRKGRISTGGDFDAVSEVTADPSQPVGRADDRLDLQGALARLVRDERLCVVLAHSEGLSHGEVADATGLPLGTVKSHVTRGSAKLRVLLKGVEA